MFSWRQDKVADLSNFPVKAVLLHCKILSTLRCPQTWLENRWKSPQKMEGYSVIDIGDHRTQWKCSIVMLDSWRVMLHFLLGGCHVSLSLTGLAMTMIWGLCRNKFAHVYTALQLFQCGVCCYSENNMWKNAMNKHWGSSYQILNIVEKRTGLTSPTTWSLVDTVIGSFPTSSQGKFW
jgi:hypothetical protein